MEKSYLDKQSWEKYRLKVSPDTDTLISGDSWDSDTLEVKGFDSDETDVSSTIIESPSVSDDDIYFWVKGGTVDEDYNIRVRCNTTLGEKLEDDLTLRIRDKA